MFLRLFGLLAALLLVSIGLLGLTLVSRVERQFREQVEDNLKTKALLIEETLRRPAPSGALADRAGPLAVATETRITLIAADGRVIFDSEEDARQMENHAQRPEVQMAR